MAQLGTQIGLAGGARSYGIPAASSITWTGISGASRSGTLLRTVNFTLDADSSDSHGLDGEFQVRRTVRRRATAHFEVIPVSGGVSILTSDALAIANDPPPKNSLMTVAGANLQSKFANAYWMVTGSALAFTPDGEAVLNIDAECFLDDSGTSLTLVAFTVS